MSGRSRRLATTTLTIADLLTIAGAIIGPLIAIGVGALAWLRADMATLDERQRADMAKLDERQRANTAKLEGRLRVEIAKLDERQRADTAAINMRLDTLTQTIITSAIARGPQADLATEGASQAVPASSAKQPKSLGAAGLGVLFLLSPGRGAGR